MTHQVRGSNEADNFSLGILGSAYLGLAGDDVYVLDPNLVPPGTEITLLDAPGSTLRLPEGVDIASSIVAAGASGATLRLSLTNGTDVTVLGADGFAFDIGGDTGGNGAATRTLETLLTETLGIAAGVPAPGGRVDGGPVLVETPPDPALPAGAIEIAAPGDVAAGPGPDVFFMHIDNAGVAGGEIGTPAFDGGASITRFDPAEDRFVFANAPGSTVTEDDILAAEGEAVLENPLDDTLGYVFAEDTAVSLTFFGPVRQDADADGTLDFIEVI